VTSSIQGCPTVKSSGDLKHKEALVEGITTRKRRRFSHRRAGGGHHVTRYGGVTQPYDAVGSHCVTRYGGATHKGEAKGSFPGISAFSNRENLACWRKNKLASVINHGKKLTSSEIFTDYLVVRSQPNLFFFYKGKCIYATPRQFGTGGGYVGLQVKIPDYPLKPLGCLL